MPVLYGFLEGITYYNEENNFVVAKLQEKGKKELTTIVGNLSGVNAGESLKLSGRWVHNRQFTQRIGMTIRYTPRSMPAERSDIS